MEKSVYLVWHLGNVIYVGSTMNLLERRAGHITQSLNSTKVSGITDYMRAILTAGGRMKKFEFAYQEIYRGENYIEVEEKTILEMKEKYPNLLNRSTIACGNNSTIYKRIPPKVTREQIEKSIRTRQTTDCMKWTEERKKQRRGIATKKSIPVLVDGVEFISASEAARHLGVTVVTVLRAANGTQTRLTNKIKFKETK